MDRDRGQRQPRQAAGQSREAFSGFFSVLGVRDGAVVGVPKTGTEDGGQAGLISAPQAVPEVAR